MDFEEVIKNGQTKLAYCPIKCNRCSKSYVYEFVTYQNIIICRKCITSIEEEKKKEKS